MEFSLTLDSLIILILQITANIFPGVSMPLSPQPCHFTVSSVVSNLTFRLQALESRDSLFIICLYSFDGAGTSN